MRIFKVEQTVRCGQWNCAVAPGDFCLWLRASHFGQAYSCGLFHERLRDEPDGWIKRCADCIEAEKKAAK